MHYKKQYAWLGSLLSLLFVILLTVSTTQYAYGEPRGYGTDGYDQGTVQNPGGTVQNPGGTVQNPGPPGGLINPLKSDTINEFLLKIIDVLLTFAVPVIIFFIMYGGFKLVTARGDTGKIVEGRSAITWAVIGGVVVLGAKLIIGVIQGTVNAL
jgi:hypothetical protein